MTVAELKSLAKEIQTLVQNTQSLISNLSKNQENGKEKPASHS